MPYLTRLARITDVPEITAIFNQGIEDEIATLGINSKSEKEIGEWFIYRSKQHPVIVIENESHHILGWASLNPFNSQCCYAGVADISIYIERMMRSKGLGRILLSELIQVGMEQGFHKLVLSALNDNTIGKSLYLSLGFKVVGIYERQGMINGKWQDVILMEKHLD